MNLLLDIIAFMGCGAYSVALVFFGFKEGRKSKWQETKDFSPVTESEKPTAELMPSDREQPQTLLEG